MSSDINHVQKFMIKALYSEGKSISWIAESLELSRTTVHSVLNNKGGKRQRQRADRYEAFFSDQDSGCYLNGDKLLSDEQAAYGDPLELLIIEETITELIKEKKWDCE